MRPSTLLQNVRRRKHWEELGFPALCAMCVTCIQALGFLEPWSKMWAPTTSQCHPADTGGELPGHCRADLASTLASPITSSHLYGCQTNLKQWAPPGKHERTWVTLGNFFCVTSGLPKPRGGVPRCVISVHSLFNILNYILIISLMSSQYFVLKVSYLEKYWQGTKI